MPRWICLKLLVRALLGAALLPVAVAAELQVLQIVPLSGVDGGAGWHMQVGAQVAFQEANASRALGEHRLVLTTLDQQPSKVVEQLREAQRHGAPVALLGPYGRRGLQELLKPGAGEPGLPVIGPLVGSELATRGAPPPWLFVTRGSFADEIESVFRHLAMTSAQRVAVVTTDNDDGAEIAQLSQELARETGVQLVTLQKHLPDSAQVAAAVREVLRTPHETVLLISNTAAVALFAKLYREGGGVAQLVALSSAEATQLAAVVGAPAAHGVLISQLAPNPRDPKIRLMREFMAAYTRFGPEKMAPTLMMTESYIAARVLIEGLRRSGSTPTATSLTSALQGLGPSVALSGLAVAINRKSTAYRSLSMIGREGALVY